MGISKFLSRLGGANYEVIRHLDVDTRTKYLNLGCYPLLTTRLAFIGGYDKAHQFTSVYQFFTLLRIPAGIGNIFLTSMALSVWINRSIIDSNLRKKAAKIIDRYKVQLLHLEIIE